MENKIEDLTADEWKVKEAIESMFGVRQDANVSPEEYEDITNQLDQIDEDALRESIEISNDIPSENIDEESVTEVEEVSEPHVIDEKDPLNNATQYQLGKLMKQVADIVRVMESTWCASKEEFKITDTQMKLLYQYNEEHKISMPEDLSKEEKEKWDHFNGLNNITIEDTEKIFGEGHLIIGVSIEQTLDRVKDVANDFYSWMGALKEYRQIHDAYVQLIQVEEDKNIEILKSIMEKEEDPEKKEQMHASIETFYSQKFLGFMSEGIEPKIIEKIIKAFSDESKVEYWFKRSRDKLKQIKISPKFLLEISQFEKRFLPEEYHVCNNVILLYFMQSVIYCDLYDKKSIGRGRIVSIVFALDGIIRQTWSDEMKEKVFENLKKFLDQFIDKVPKKTV